MHFRFFLLLCLIFPAFFTAQTPIPVADQTFKVEGTHDYYYAFATGDQIDLFIQLIAGRRLKTVEIIGLPDNTIFRSYELDTALRKSIIIPQTGVYLLRINEQGLGKKICRFTISRSAASPASARMDTRVWWDAKTQPRWAERQRPIHVGTKTESVSITGQVTVPSSNMGIRKNRTSYRFDFPPNTTRWAYRIGVNQSVQEARRKDAEQFQRLVNQGATKLLAFQPETALAAFAIGMAVNMTTATGGEDIEYAIVDPANLEKFMDGADKYDAFIWQGAVSVDVQRRFSPLAGSYAFALKNNNLIDDVNVNIEVEAITEAPIFEFETYLEPLQP